MFCCICILHKGWFMYPQSYKVGYENKICFLRRRLHMVGVLKYYYYYIDVVSKGAPIQDLADIPIQPICYSYNPG